jgi:glycosyltransferase involved in cell wall biosynthesis
LVKREKIGIILSTDPYLCGIIGLLVKWFTGAPLVIWVVANYDAVFNATGKPAMPRLFRWRWVEKIVERTVFHCADLVAGGNKDNLEFALKNGAAPARSTVFPVGKLIHKSHLMKPVLRDDDAFFATNKQSHFFIYVGRLLEVKHPDDVIRAFSVIDREVPNCALIMAGDGTMRADLERLAHELNIPDKVHFLGNVSQERLANLLAGCFAVLSPLTGRSLIEAALAEIPIVAYDRDWQSDFVGASAGIIVPFRDWHKMGEAAVHLLSHLDEARRMGESARNKGLEACDLEKIYAHEKMEFGKLLVSRQS